MDDLGLTKLCADAMGLHPSPYGQDRFEIVTWHGPNGERPTYHIYDPLHDDAQAMQLVKKFGFDLRGMRENGALWWGVGGTDGIRAEWCYGNDLNRAIVECVAKMQKEKSCG